MNGIILFSSVWQEGRGTHIWILRQVEESQCFLSNQYTGNFVQGLRHGRGTFYHASGAVYEGEWLDNKSVSTVNQPGITASNYQHTGSITAGFPLTRSNASEVSKFKEQLS